MRSEESEEEISNGDWNWGRDMTGVCLSALFDFLHMKNPQLSQGCDTKAGSQPFI